VRVKQVSGALSPDASDRPAPHRIASACDLGSNAQAAAEYRPEARERFGVDLLRSDAEVAVLPVETPIAVEKTCGPRNVGGSRVARRLERSRLTLSTIQLPLPRCVARQTASAVAVPAGAIPRELTERLRPPAGRTYLGASQHPP